MKYALLCRLKADSLTTLRALRGRHLEYIAAHEDSIFVGGPSHGEDGLPHTMIIILDVPGQAEAEAFSHNEPYTASGQVFESVLIQPWSQVIPEAEVGVLRQEIEKENATKP